jgi:hypothetical protein
VRAGRWRARNPKELAQFGFTDNGQQVTIELKNGATVALEFGGEAGAGWQHAKVVIGGEVWVFDFPWPIYRDVANYLSVPALP